jgi:ABC-type sugar transport system permease subunit
VIAGRAQDTRPRQPPRVRRPDRSEFHARGLRRQVPAHLFMLPATAMVLVFLIWPFLRTVALSLTDADGVNPAQFVGFDNYTRFLEDPILVQSLTNTLIWLAGSLMLPVIIGFLVAWGTYRFAGGALYRLPFILPYVLSGTAVGVVWSFLLASDGVVNEILVIFGLEGLMRSWLLQPPANTFAMIVASTWQVVGINVILFLVGLQAIPQDPIDAARVDGAQGLSLLRHVIIPLIRPMSVVVIGMTLVNSLRTFDIIWLMTQGGPYRSSETLAVTMFREAFLLFRHGYGAAIAVLLTVFNLAVATIYLRRQLRAV